MTYLIDGERFMNMLFQIKNDFIVCFRRRICHDLFNMNRKLWHSVAAYYGDQQLFQVKKDQLLGSEHTILTLLHFFQIRVVQRRGDAAARLCNEKSHDIPFRA